MENEIQFFLRRLMSVAVRDPVTVTHTYWGMTRTFVRFDCFDDTFIFEEGVWDHLKNREPVVLIPKSALRPGETSRVFGNVLMVSSGNHTTTLLPLVTGAFWDLAALPPEDQPEVITHKAVCANCVGNTFELSQRAVPTELVAEMDDWLINLGYPMANVVLSDRIDTTLDYYSKRGQEWRIKQLAWTPSEMKAVFDASVSYIHSPIRYYHNVRGVHFLTWKNFRAWGDLLREDFSKFMLGLEELCESSAEHPLPALLEPKYQSHHEIEFFGLPPGLASTTMIPALIDLHKHLLKLDLANPDSARDAAERFEPLAARFLSLLVDRALADESSPTFLETIYRHLNGEVYRDANDGISRVFDDHLAALPGATYINGRRYPHAGADARTIAILDMLEKSTSAGDQIQWVNVHELRSAETERIRRRGEGKTREIVYQTLLRPLPRRIIEKRLARGSTGYGSYTMARIQAFRALGISYGRHHLLERAGGIGGAIHFYTRDRYPGTPFSQLPPSAFYPRDPATGLYDTTSESPDVVIALMRLMGGAAAENLVLKKAAGSPLSARFAVGKEIVEFGYDVRVAHEMPLRVHLCSVRGTLGWPCIDKTDENLRACWDFFTNRYAEVVAQFAARHSEFDPVELGTAFTNGFAARTRELAWNYAAHREQFDDYDPCTFKDFHFLQKWRFALWALERQRDCIDQITGDIRRKLARNIADAKPAPSAADLTNAL